MKNDQYTTFEDVAKPAMQRVMTALKAELQLLGFECDDPIDIDHDVERGVGVDIHHPAADTPIGLELMLTDGDERDFTSDPEHPKCGLMLSVVGPGGAFLGEWCPNNYSDDVGTTDPREIVRLVDLIFPVHLARSIQERIAAWAERQSEIATAPHP